MLEQVDGLPPGAVFGANSFTQVARAAPDGLLEPIWASSAADEPAPEERRRHEQRLREHQEQLRARSEVTELFASKWKRERLVTEVRDAIRSSGRVMVRAVGAISTMQALKAIAAANAMLQATDLKGEQVIAATPYYQQVRLKGEEVQRP